MIICNSNRGLFDFSEKSNLLLSEMRLLCLLMVRISLSYTPTLLEKKDKIEKKSLRKFPKFARAKVEQALIHF